ncbi:helix-turn-helix domain-containing protein [Desulfosporosinus youngiae]|uniref:Putative transcriptional regulator n=1 Tax=Desulfosporosinus youngiae DSM 17734 TaxID=768710 RepID=H5XSR6_9FIRM|nr:helix-turn-helix transcriptional regulator [Desulfosporosinus youngiae]EHQ87734.1 putative transcriptional regulator [Desulfosporosinus youngiae DSM 17734]
MSDLGKFILEHRTAKNLSSRKLAELANISHTEIHRLEHGERKKPSPLVLKAIAIPLGVTFEEIMHASGYMESSPPCPVTSRITDIDDLTDQEIEEVRDFIDFLRSKRKRKLTIE